MKTPDGIKTSPDIDCLPKAMCPMRVVSMVITFDAWQQAPLKGCRICVAGGNEESRNCCNQHQLNIIDGSNMAADAANRWRAGSGRRDQHQACADTLKQQNTHKNLRSDQLNTNLGITNHYDTTTMKRYRNYNSISVIRNNIDEIFFVMFHSLNQTNLSTQDNVLL